MCSYKREASGVRKQPQERTGSFRRVGPDSPRPQPCCRRPHAALLVIHPLRNSVLVTEQLGLPHASGQARRHAVHRASPRSSSWSRGRCPRAHLVSDRKRVWPGLLRGAQLPRRAARATAHCLRCPHLTTSVVHSHHRVYIVLTLPCFTLSPRRRPTSIISILHLRTTTRLPV